METLLLLFVLEGVAYVLLTKYKTCSEPYLIVCYYHGGIGKKTNYSEDS